MKLREFLVEAKKATYANENHERKVLADGSYELTFAKGDFKYRDRYFGVTTFTGEEVVWRGGELVWSMNYFGKVLAAKIPAKEFGLFQKKAMREVNTDRPFRGPRQLIAGEWEYRDESVGDVDRFTGTEKIFFKGEEVCRLDYHGGAMQ